MQRNRSFHPMMLAMTLSLSAISCQTAAGDGYGIGGLSGQFTANIVTQVSPNCTQETGSSSTSITCTNGSIRCTTTYAGSSAQTRCIDTRPLRIVDPLASSGLIDDSLAYGH